MFRKVKRLGSEASKVQVSIAINNVSFADKSLVGMSGCSVLFERGGRTVSTAVQTGENAVSGGGGGSVLKYNNEKLTLNLTLYKESKGGYHEKSGRLVVRQSKGNKGFMGNETFAELGIVLLSLHEICNAQLADGYTAGGQTLTLPLSKCKSTGSVEVTITASLLGDVTLEDDVSVVSGYSDLASVAGSEKGKFTFSSPFGGSKANVAKSSQAGAGGGGSGGGGGGSVGGGEVAYTSEIESLRTQVRILSMNLDRANADKENLAKMHEDALREAEAKLLEATSAGSEGSPRSRDATDVSTEAVVGVEIEVLRVENKELKGRIEENAAQQALSTSLQNSLKMQVEELTSQLEENKAMLAEVAIQLENVHELEQNALRLEKEKKDLLEQQEQAKSYFLAISTELDTAKSAKTFFSTQIENVTKRLSEEQQLHAQTQVILQEAVAEHKAAIATAQNNTSSLQDQIASLEAQCKELAIQGEKRETELQEKHRLANEKAATIAGAESANAKMEQLMSQMAEVQREKEAAASAASARERVLAVATAKTAAAATIAAAEAARQSSAQLEQLMAQMVDIKKEKEAAVNEVAAKSSALVEERKKSAAQAVDMQSRADEIASRLSSSQAACALLQEQLREATQSVLAQKSALATSESDAASQQSQIEDLQKRCKELAEQGGERVQAMENDLQKKSAQLAAIEHEKAALVQTHNEKMYELAAQLAAAVTTLATEKESAAAAAATAAIAMQKEIDSKVRAEREFKEALAASEDSARAASTATDQRIKAVKDESQVQLQQAAAAAESSKEKEIAIMVAEFEERILLTKHEANEQIQAAKLAHTQSLSELDGAKAELEAYKVSYTGTMSDIASAYEALQQTHNQTITQLKMAVELHKNSLGELEALTKTHAELTQTHTDTLKVLDELRAELEETSSSLLESLRTSLSAVSAAATASSSSSADDVLQSPATPSSSTSPSIEEVQEKFNFSQQSLGRMGDYLDEERHRVLVLKTCLVKFSTSLTLQDRELLLSNGIILQKNTER